MIKMVNISLSMSETEDRDRSGSVKILHSSSAKLLFEYAVISLNHKIKNNIFLTIITEKKNN